ncbi:MAG: efflux RND transporter permease subunit, partial [bacterium]|nr:efflux RND transporter permease subunit [bacterium]
SEVLGQKLLAIDGVKSFTDISGVKEKIYIDLAPQYLNPAIIEQITTANIGFPLGQSVINGKVTPISGASTIKSLDDVRNISISIPGNPTPMKLGDVASVYLGTDTGNKVHRVGYLDEADNKFKIQPALLYEIRLTKDADLLQVGEEVQKAVDETKSPNNKTDYAIVFNQSEEARAQVDEIVEAAIGGKWDIDGPLAYLGFLFGGVWLLILAMLLFLDWRSALISALAIPLSFLFTFIILSVAGIQLNTLVLFSFVLVLGLIVDPAIVVLESIKRYMELGLRGNRAVLRAVDVIGFGLFIAVLTSMIVFIPFSVVSGTFGQIIKYIPWTVFPALIASYFIPLVFLTWLAGKYLKGNPDEQLRDEDDPHTLWPIARWFIRANRYILQHLWLQVAIVILGLAVPIGVSAFLFSSGQVRQVQFSQPDDVEYLQLSIPRAANQTPSELQAQVGEVEGILKNHISEIKTFFYQDISGGGGSSQNLSVFIELMPPADRDRKSPVIAEDIQDEVQQKFGDLASASELGAGPPTESYPVTVKIFENDANKLRDASQKIANELRTYSEVDGVITDNDRSSKELVVTVDPVKASSLGTNSAAVYGQIAGFLGEKKVYRVGEYDVVVRVAADSKPNTLEALQSLALFGQNGPVTVGQVATISEETVPGSIRRLEGERYTQVSARLKDARDAINVQRKITDWSKSNSVELGLSDRAFEDRAGVNEFEKSFQELFLAIGLSILATYIVFVLFFRSFVQPLIILFAIPLILIGVFPALAIFAGGQFGFLETIGILMVIGIAENVGIFLIDYANRKVAEGMDKKEAIALASGIRFRPVILTKVTALAGLLPLAVFSPFWRGLSLVVIFGILSSGVLSLFTTPVLYSWFTRQKKQVGNPQRELDFSQHPSVATEPTPVESEQRMNVLRNGSGDPIV